MTDERIIKWPAPREQPKQEPTEPWAKLIDRKRERDDEHVLREWPGWRH